MLRLVDVTRPWHRSQFLKLAWRVHGQDSKWVPPLWLYYRQMMGRAGDGHRRFLLALQDGEPVARLGVKPHDGSLHFGFFECLPGSEKAVAALVAEAHRSAPQLPLRGPYHFRMEDPYTGLLVDGFDHEPTFFMSYNPPYYLPYLEAAGFTKLKDLLSYDVLPSQVDLGVMERRAQRAQRKGIQVRTLDAGRLRSEVETIADVFNDALSGNWGFEPIEGEQLRDFQLLARFVLNPRWVWLASRDGQDVGSLVVLPNYNPLIKPSGGRLTPALLWRLAQRWRRIDTFRGYALGVRAAHRADEVSAALVHAMLSEGRRTRWRSMEISWILEDNRPMNAMIGALGGVRSKVYRVLEKPPLH